MDERIEEIRERAEKATGVQWWAQSLNSHHAVIWNHGDEGAGAICRLDRESKYHRGRGNISADVDFISHSRDDIPYLLAKVDHLHKRQHGPRIVLFESRGGQMRCGEFVELLPENRIRVLTAHKGKIKYTSVKEEKKRSPEELCAAYNVLLAKVDHLQKRQQMLLEERDHFRRKAQEAARLLTSYGC